MDEKHLPDGWTHESQGPYADAWWNDSLSVGIQSDERDEPRVYTICHKNTGEPVCDRNGAPLRYHDLLGAILAALSVGTESFGSK